MKKFCDVKIPKIGGLQGLKVAKRAAMPLKALWRKKKPQPLVWQRLILA